MAVKRDLLIKKDGNMERRVIAVLYRDEPKELLEVNGEISCCLCMEGGVVGVDGGYGCNSCDSKFDLHSESSWYDNSLYNPAGNLCLGKEPSKRVSEWAVEELPNIDGLINHFDVNNAKGFTKLDFSHRSPETEIEDYQKFLLTEKMAHRHAHLQKELEKARLNPIEENLESVEWPAARERCFNDRIPREKVTYEDLKRHEKTLTHTKQDAANSLLDMVRGKFD